jgi:hypothetical protein
VSHFFMNKRLELYVNIKPYNTVILTVFDYWFKVLFEYNEFLTIKMAEIKNTTFLKNIKKAIIINFTFYSGMVHDAMASSSYLKFYPNIQKYFTSEKSLYSDNSYNK